MGYARVSTSDQNLDAQLDQLREAGVERIFEEKVTGARRQRTQLDALLGQLREGDVVAVTKYDRLARSLKDLLEIVEAVRAQDAGVRSLAEDIDTITPVGRLVFHVFASIAEFERDRISERTKEGLAAARKRGRVGGQAPCPISRSENRSPKDARRWTLDPGNRTVVKVSQMTMRRA